jgi:MSHA pilin protein MshA
MGTRLKGFTLIELILVIVILGILASVAAPKFVNLSGAATESKLRALQGVIKSANILVFSKAAIENKRVGSTTIDVNGIPIAITDGYAASRWEASIRHLINLSEQPFTSDLDTVCTTEWCGVGTQVSITEGVTVTPPAFISKIVPQGYTINSRCSVYYVHNADGTRPTVNISTIDC